MNKLDRIAIAAKTKVSMLAEKVKDSLTNKNFGDSQVVVALVLIVVAVGLAIIFRNQVNGIVQLVAKRVKDVVTTLANGALVNDVN